MCFYFKGDKKFSEDVGFNCNIKGSSVKDGDDGDEALKDSNLAFFLNILILYLFSFCLVSDTFLCFRFKGDKKLSENISFNYNY